MQLSRACIRIRVCPGTQWPTLHNGNDSLFLCDITCLWHVVGRRIPARGRSDGCYVCESIQVQSVLTYMSKDTYMCSESCRKKKRARYFARSGNVEIPIRHLLLIMTIMWKLKKSPCVVILIGLHWLTRGCRLTADGKYLSSCDSCCYNSHINFTNSIPHFVNSKFINIIM